MDWEQSATEDRPVGMPTLGEHGAGRWQENQARAGSLRPWGPDSGRKGSLQVDSHPSETSRRMRTKKRPSALATVRSQVTSHRALADVILSVLQSPACCHPQAQPLPLGKPPSPVNPLIRFFPRCSPDALLLSLCYLNLHLSSCCSANVFISYFTSLCF